MKRIIKGSEPPCLLQYRQTRDANYDGYHPKELLKTSLEAIKKKLEELSSKDAEDKYSPYCQYIVWYLSKRLNIP